MVLLLFFLLSFCFPVFVVSTGVTTRINKMKTSAPRNSVSGQARPGLRLHGCQRGEGARRRRQGPLPGAGRLRGGRDGRRRQRAPRRPPAPRSPPRRGALRQEDKVHINMKNAIFESGSWRTIFLVFVVFQAKGPRSGPAKSDPQSITEIRVLGRSFVAAFRLRASVLKTKKPFCLYAPVGEPQ